MSQAGSKYITKLTEEEKVLRRELRHALRRLHRAMCDRHLVYASPDHGDVQIDPWDFNRLFFEVYDNPDDDDEEPGHISAYTSDEELVEQGVIDEPSTTQEGEEDSNDPTRQ